jgi:hypothetical protein
MPKVPVAVRLDQETLERADEYAKKRGVSRQVLLESAILEYLELAKTGVPDLVAQAKRQAYKKTEAPDQPKPSREDFARSTAERAEFFSRLDTRGRMTFGSGRSEEKS